VGPEVNLAPRRGGCRVSLAPEDAANGLELLREKASVKFHSRKVFGASLLGEDIEKGAIEVILRAADSRAAPCCLSNVASDPGSPVILPDNAGFSGWLWKRFNWSDYAPA